jgi:hypothetical protein
MHVFKISLLEEDIMKAEERFTTASGKLEEASKAADESERYTSTIYIYSFLEISISKTNAIGNL